MFTWILIVIHLSGGSMIHVEFDNIESCAIARREVMELSQNVRAVCERKK